MAIMVREEGSSTKYDVDRVDTDWSSRHVRLRFEMLVSAIIFFFVASYGTQVVNLPFINLPQNVDGSIVLWLSLGFAAFAMISFVVRSQYERALWPKHELSNTREITKFYNDFCAIETNFLKMKVESQEDAEFLEAVYHKKNDIKKFGYLTNTFMQLLTDLHEENGLNSPVHPKFWGKVVSEFSRFNRHSNRISDISEDLNFEHGRFITRSYNLVSVQDIVTDMQKKLRLDLKTITPEITERVDYLKRHSKIKWFQTQFLSVAVPTFTASIFVFFGSYKLIMCAN